MSERAERDRGGEEPAGEPVVIRIAPRGYSGRQRAVAAVLAACFLLLLFYPFLAGVRLRYLFTPVPRIGRPDAGEAVPVTVTAAELRRAEELVVAEVERQAFPGAALAVGQGPRVLLERGYGRSRWGRLALVVDPHRTQYDLSSLSKTMGTTTAVMLLVDDGRMRLDDPVSRFIPEFTGGGREKVTIRHLLTHTSGLVAGVPEGRELEGGSPRGKLLRLIAEARLVDEPGAGVLYSDVGFIVLGEAVARAAGEPLPALLRRRVWEPLGMADTRYQPGLLCRRCAPTLSLDDGTPFAGKANDPLARQLGGMTGNAGLFSTAHDVARWAAMLAGGGQLGGVRIVREATLREFTRVQRGTRALGFEVFCREGTVPYHEACETVYAYGHTGYTGTSVWMEPGRGTWVVLLTNRTYLPRAENRIGELRRELYEVVTGMRPAPDSASAARDSVSADPSPADTVAVSGR